MKSYNRCAGLERGAQIVIQNWIQIRPWDKLLIVTNTSHMAEAEAMAKYARKRAMSVNQLVVEKDGVHVGVFFDIHENVFDPYTAIIAATDYSLVTTKAAKRAISKKKKFLSLPLSTNDGVSMLAYDFMTMDTKKSKMMSQLMMKYLRQSTTMRAVTAAGTDLRVCKRGRDPGFFNGVTRDGRGFSSASIEVYVPIEEEKTEGTLVVDGSFGYIGKPGQPVRVKFEKGRIVDIESNEDGKRLASYMRDYEDEDIYVAGEFGIGLNSISKCRGNCYIEDESTYGTFHIGMGRNIGLGGRHEAKGHFDLVMQEPDIYVDNRLVMQHGKIIISSQQIFEGVYLQ